MTAPGRLRAALRRRRGNVAWDGILRGSALIALLGIGVMWYGSPAAGGLVAFLIVTIWVNGPLGMFLPATYEPILMLFGRVYPPVLVAALGIVGTLYVEFLNYHLYAKVLRLPGFNWARDSGVVRRTIRLFEKAPFFTVWLCSWSPLPYWVVRLVGPLAGYPVNKYLLATLLGRFPRLWFFAALGLYWNIGASPLAAVSLGAIVLTVLAWAANARRSPAPVAAATLPATGEMSP